MEHSLQSDDAVVTSSKCGGFSTKGRNMETVASETQSCTNTPRIVEKQNEKESVLDSSSTSPTSHTDVVTTGADTFPNSETPAPPPTPTPTPSCTPSSEESASFKAVERTENMNIEHSPDASHTEVREVVHELCALGGIKDENQFTAAMKAMFDLRDSRELTEYLYKAIDNCNGILRTDSETRIQYLMHIESGVRKYCQYRPTIGHYNAIIKVCCINDNVDGMLYFVNQLKEAGYEPDDVTYGTIITVYAKNGDLQTAVNMFASMEKNGLSPNDTAYNAIFDAYRARGDTKGATYLLGIMEKRGVAPTTNARRGLIQLFARSHGSKFLNRAINMYQGMTQDNIIPDNKTFHALLYALLKTGRTTEGRHIFENGLKIQTHVSKTKAKPYGGPLKFSSKTYNMMTEAYIKDRDFIKAIEVCNDMPSDMRDVKTLRNMLIAYRSVNDLERMECVVEQMREARVTDDVYKKAVHITRTMQMLDRVIKRNTDISRGSGFEPWSRDGATMSQIKETEEETDK
eukprot:CFRG4698T1